MTREEKFKMYNKLSKKELINLLIESQEQQFHNYTLTGTTLSNGSVLYNEICGCNPLNGGSGNCNCTMANTVVTL